MKFDLHTKRYLGFCYKWILLFLFSWKQGLALQSLLWRHMPEIQPLEASRPPVFQGRWLLVHIYTGE
jgi:hypothetical protein